ncbi:enoyl-CoA hydratase/isomerase family protein [Propylenella binzhouense]|uniref:Enoyl-CoA hydratase n=1 Tax=Propylenella binzhouense TaxID=2555902 RepID=A0A964T863_9HYPH|nr:enoyl-CoA hydratase-related protein [Propylenella binzhouense]MYZ50293.1 enoyl-CoA hydratase [Propylenella binzhouense]
MYDFQHLEVERPSEGVLLLRFNRPEVLNAVNTQLGREIVRIFGDLAAGAVEDVRCVVLTGAGERAFCVGGDLKERNGMTDAQWMAQRVIFRQYNLVMERCPVPVVCAVNGLALGGGAEMVLRSDFAYAAEDARFGFPEVKRGFMPGSGGTQRFGRVVGEPRAKEYLMTGEQFTAADALAWGMVNRLFPRSELLPATLAVAAKIAANPREAVRVIKQCVHAGLQTDIETGLVIEALGHQKLTSSPDRMEGIAAFVEKRSPEWQKG